MASPTYTVSIAHRVPQSSGEPTLTELGPVVASGISWTEELTRDGEASASTTPDSLPAEIIDKVVEWVTDVDVSDGSAVTGFPGLELWIHRGSSRVFQGPIIGLQIAGEPATWTFRAAGLLYYLRYMILLPGSTLAFSGVDQHTIAKTLVDDWQDLSYGHFGLDTSAITESGVNRDRTYVAGDRVYQRLIELAEVDNGFEVWTTEDREIMLGTKGTDLTGSVVLDRRGITNPSLAISVAEGDIASEVYASNTDGTAPLTSTKAATAVRESFGRVGISASFDGVTVQGTLDDHAQSLLDARGRPLVVPQPELIPVTGAGVEDFGVGDTIQFVPRIGVDGVVLERRVLRRRVAVDDDGNETISVALS